MSLLGVQYWGLKIYYVAFFYPCLIVFADLSASQMLDEKRLVKVRFVLILTGFLFLLPNYFREMLDLRYYILMLIILYCIFFGMVPKNLKIKSSILYLICVYTSYSIVLYLMAKIISSPEELKVWYLFSQIILPLWKPIGDNFEIHMLLILIITGTLVFLFFIIRGKKLS